MGAGQGAMGWRNRISSESRNISSAAAGMNAPIGADLAAGGLSPTRGAASRAHAPEKKIRRAGVTRRDRRGAGGARRGRRQLGGDYFKGEDQTSSANQCLVNQARAARIRVVRPESPGPCCQARARDAVRPGPVRDTGESYLGPPHPNSQARIRVIRPESSRSESSDPSHPDPSHQATVRVAHPV